METELVEKVARAIARDTRDRNAKYVRAAGGWKATWDELDVGSQDYEVGECEPAAKAAIAAIDESRSVSVEDEAAALVMLANEFNIPPDVQEVLVRGSLSRNIKPGALKSLLAMKPLPAPPGDIE